MKQAAAEEEKFTQSGPVGEEGTRDGGTQETRDPDADENKEEPGTMEGDEEEIAAMFT